MNKYIRIAIEVPTGVLKAFIINAFHRRNAKISFLCAFSPLAELTIDNGGRIFIGDRFRARSGSHVRVRKNATLSIGKNVSVNHGCMLVCRESIRIGNDVQFSPNVMVYDHDHDFRAVGGVKSMKYKSTPIVIGNNVWIGSNTVILRGSYIGNNCVIGAGSIVHGKYEDNSIVIQKRFDTIKSGVGE